MDDEQDLSRKEQKFMGKIARKIDRSGRKKSDRDREEVCNLEGEVGLVTAQGSTHISVQLDSRMVSCALSGLLKKDRWDYKNLVAVGDRVKVRLHGENGHIISILPRTSFLERVDPTNVRRRHVLAANIDYLLITASLLEPRLKPHLIDRFIVAAYQGGLTPVILINKIDLLEQSDLKELLTQMRAIYRSLGIGWYEISGTRGDGIQELLTLLQGKTALFAGQSGVGKSSLINQLTDSTLRTSAVTTKTDKGIHTTTQAMLVPFKTGGYCVDTPGIRNFMLPPISRIDLEAAAVFKGRDQGTANKSDALPIVSRASFRKNPTLLCLN